MAAPTNAALVKKESPCQLGAVHTWPVTAAMAEASRGSFRGNISRASRNMVRQFLTQSDTSRLPIAALRKAMTVRS
jgi:hypothetical protein